MNYSGVIYIIKNNVTDDCYVGQTRQKVSTRWANHVQKLNGNTHHSKRLQEGWAHYGQNAFSFIEIYYALNRHDLNEVEKEVIKELAPKYNMTSGGAGSKDRIVGEAERKKSSTRLKTKWSDPAWREKQIKRLKESHKTEAHIQHIKSIQHLGLQKRWGNHIKKEKVKALTTQSERTKISWDNAEIRAKRIEGLILSSKRPEVIAKRKKASFGRVMPKESVEKSAKAKWKPVLCKELGISFLCMKFASEFLNIGQSTISEAIRMNRKVFGQYSFCKVI